MTALKRVLLINPTITSARHARFPLAIMSLSASLDGRYESTIIDGNVERNYVAAALHALNGGDVAAVGVTVMGGPQLRSAITVSKAVREKQPNVPIIWGGAFPTVCPEASLNASYVDYAVRAQGEETFLALLTALTKGSAESVDSIPGLTWRAHGGVVHNKDRAFSAASLNRMLPYDKLENPKQYLTNTYLGRRTIGYQASLGCRFRCNF